MVFAQRVQLIFGIFNFPRDNRKFKVPFNNVSECPQEYELQLERKRRGPCDLESGNGTLWFAGWLKSKRRIIRILIRIEKL